MIEQLSEAIRTQFWNTNSTPQTIADEMKTAFLDNRSTCAVHQDDLNVLAYTALNSQSILAVDTETGGLSPLDHKLHLVQIATLNGDVHVIQNPGPHSRLLRQLLFNTDIAKVCHWMKFDAAFLLKGLVTPLSVEETWEQGFNAAADKATWSHNIDIFESFVCTKVLTKLLKPGMNASLKNSVKLFLDVELDKQVEHGNWDAEVLSERQLEYAANDVLVLLPLLTSQISDLHALDLVVQMRMNSVSIQAQKALAFDALLQMNGFTDLTEHGYDSRRCKNPLLRQPEVPNELDDSWNDGNSGGSQTPSSSS